MIALSEAEIAARLSGSPEERAAFLRECAEGGVAEAQALYDDLTPPPPPKTIVLPMPRYEGKGRPTKKDRRNLIPKGGDMLE